MKDRIKAIRKDQQMNQSEFANDLGIPLSNIQSYEIGRRAPSEASIKLICSKYKVNEEWLRTGNGEMKQPRSDNEIIAKFVNDVMESRSDDFRKRLINALSQLDEREWKVLEEIAKKMQ